MFAGLQSDWVGQTVSLGRGVTGQRLRFDLLSEQVAAEGDAAIQSNGGKVGATAAFALGPAANRGRDAPANCLQEVKHSEVSANRANLTAIFGPIGAEPEELDHPTEVFSRGRRRKPSDVLDFRRKNVTGRGRDQGPAIRHKEL